MRLRLIACEILYREFCWAVARSIHQVDADFLPKGLHDLGADPMRRRLQEAIDRTDPSRYDAVLLGYALCGMGLAGLRARALPLVVPRAHDCIALFLGSRQRYAEYFRSHAGTYFLTSGWIERGQDLPQLAIQQKLGLRRSFEELAARYGEDNARYLVEQLGDLRRHYRRLAFIRMGIEPEGRFEEMARGEAERHGWEFERLEGDLSLIRRLVDGPWDDDFLRVPPGGRIVPTYDEDIVTWEAS
ncbi:MAG: DUF1638 domain-containing protein [Bryobacterales bacterium]|nr:DUF1638 domain-containing protein [Bryobacteraceae bacterium]MDW8131559.1 DUF1638 domain-containing protein [Bryobacterales bacterium]